MDTDNGPSTGYGYGQDGMHHWQICIPVMDTGYYWDNFGHRPDGMTLNDTIVMDIFWLWTTLNQYWLSTRCNETIVMYTGYCTIIMNTGYYWDNTGYGPDGMTPSCRYLLVMDRIE